MDQEARLTDDFNQGLWDEAQESTFLASSLDGCDYRSLENYETSLGGCKQKKLCIKIYNIYGLNFVYIVK